MPEPDLVRLFGAAQFAERDTVMRTIPALRERQSSDAEGLETKQRHASLVNDGGTVRLVFIQVGEAIRLFGASFSASAHDLPEGPEFVTWPGDRSR